MVKVVKNEIIEHREQRIVDSKGKFCINRHKIIDYKFINYLKLIHKN